MYQQNRDYSNDHKWDGMNWTENNDKSNDHKWDGMNWTENKDNSNDHKWRGMNWTDNKDDSNNHKGMNYEKGDDSYNHKGMNYEKGSDNVYGKQQELQHVPWGSHKGKGCGKDFVKGKKATDGQHKKNGGGNGARLWRFVGRITQQHVFMALSVEDQLKHIHEQASNN